MQTPPTHVSCRKSGRSFKPLYSAIWRFWHAAEFTFSNEKMNMLQILVGRYQSLQFQCFKRVEGKLTQNMKNRSAEGVIFQFFFDKKLGYAPFVIFR